MYRFYKLLRIHLLLLTFVILFSCQKSAQNFHNESLLLDAINKATGIKDSLKEGMEAGLNFPGSIDDLSNKINWAKFILASSKTDTAYFTAAKILLDYANTIRNNIVKKAVPKFGRGSYFDIGKVKDLVPNKSAYTIQCAIRLSDFGVDGSNGFGSFITADDGGIGLLLRYTSGGSVQTYLFDNGWFGTASGASSLQTDQWYELTYTFDGMSIKIYIDGVVKGTANTVAAKYAHMDDSYPFYVGASRNAAFGGSMHGNIKNVRFWNYALSQQEVINGLNIALTGKESGLIACWPFDLNLGNTITDKTGKFVAKANDISWE